MYKLKNGLFSACRSVKSLAIWLKRKIVLVISAFMIGMSNVIMEEDRSVNTYQNKTEQRYMDPEAESEDDYGNT